MGHRQPRKVFLIHISGTFKAFTTGKNKKTFSRSHFTTLLTESENAELLKDFVDGGCDANPQDVYQAGCGKPPLGCSPETPEEAFLSISTALRGALKKHYHEVCVQQSKPL